MLYLFKRAGQRVSTSDMKGLWMPLICFLMFVLEIDRIAISGTADRPEVSGVFALDDNTA